MVQAAKRHDLFKQRIGERAGTLAPAAIRVVEFIDNNRGAALASSAIELAQSCGTSDATVIRVVQALGFEGLNDLKHVLAATLDDSPSPAANMRRTLAEIGEDSTLAIEAVFDAHAAGLTALRTAKSKGRLLAGIRALHLAERIVIFGIGPTGAIAAYASILLERSGRHTKVLNDTGLMLADQLLDLRKGDAMLVFAYDRAYPEVSTLFHEAKRIQAPVVLITDVETSRLARFADIVIPALRGRAEHVALHGTTVICLEALVLGLSAANRTKATDTLDRLTELRRLIKRGS